MIQESSNQNRAPRLMPHLITAAVCLFLSTGCAFEREWRSTAGCSQCEDGLAGRWEGTWLSRHNGHNGKLRAIITKQDENCYQAHFHATFVGVIPFEFTTPMTAVERDGVYCLQGDADLGWLAGGVYTTSGYANGCEFEADYCASKDHGVFSMQRVQSGCACNNGCGCQTGVIPEARPMPE